MVSFCAAFRCLDGEMMGDHDSPEGNATKVGWHDARPLVVRMQLQVLWFQFSDDGDWALGVRGLRDWGIKRLRNANRS